MRHLLRLLALCVSLLFLTACPDAAEHGEARHAEKGTENSSQQEESKEEDHDVIHLSDAQIAAAGIEIATVRRGLAGVIESPAVIVADPARSVVVSVTVSGRISSLIGNIGEPVERGTALAVLESTGVAELKADLEALRRQEELAQSTLRREERLFKEKVSAEQDYLAARASAEEAKIRLRLAEERVAATGGEAEGPVNRLTVRSPLKGNVIARQGALGDVIAPNTELFRIADLSRVTVDIALAPDDASRVRVGDEVEVSTNGRKATARIAFISPVLDAANRQVHGVATLPNPKGLWRIGETVRAAVLLTDPGLKAAMSVPRDAIQTVEDKPSVFVRTDEGFEVKHLELGASNGSNVAVLSGLMGTERIAVTNSFVLKAELGKGEGGDHDH